MTAELERTLLITGASRGIGAATARLAAREGYDVAITYQNNHEKARAVVEDIRSMGRRAMAIKADAKSESELVAAFEAVDSELGPLTHLVNNASSTVKNCLIEEIDSETLDKTFRVNISSYFICSREALKRMSLEKGGNGGAIVNVSSVAALRANAFDWVHYGASKGAIDTFTVGMALEGVKHGVRCNAVRPGPIDTDMFNPNDSASVISSVPMGRLGLPEEVAEAIIFLLGTKSTYCTGSILNVSGGRF